MSEFTYWNQKGTFQDLANKLEKMVPIMGECEDKRVERFRKAVNAYYVIYNYGCCNIASTKVSYYFPGVMGIIRSNYRRPDWEAVEEITEPIMDEIVEKVAKKVGLIS